MIDAAKVTEHYGRDSLTERLRGALVAAGLDVGPVSAEQLAPLDQFHSRGLAATIELAKILNPSPAWRVLDIGSGLGGPSRYLAAIYGCHVSGVDLSSAYVEAAAYLAERAGLAGKVDYQCADALALPFDDGRFDLAWTQHVAMNIADRSGLYAEAHRVLRPGGRLAIYDVLAGEGGPLHYPVPWSRTPATSFLMTPAAMRTALEVQGFAVTSWIDRTEVAIAWFAEFQARQAASSGAPPLGLHLAMGSDFKVMSANLARNLREGRAALVEAVLTRP
jgi:SAM-dependent methyltransferase